MKATKPAKIRSSAIVLQSQARGTIAIRPRRKKQRAQTSAVIWIVVASLVGVLISQLTAMGSQRQRDVLEFTGLRTTETIRARWETRETEFALTHSGIPSLDRIHRYSGTSHDDQQVIQRETEVQPAIHKVPVAEQDADSPPADTQTQLAWAAFPDDVIPGLVQRVVHTLSELMTPVHVRPLATGETVVTVANDEQPQRGAVAYVEADTQVPAVVEHSSDSGQTEPGDGQKAGEPKHASGVSTAERPKILRTRPSLLRVADDSVMMFAPMTSPIGRNEQQLVPESGGHGIIDRQPSSESPPAVEPEIPGPATHHGQAGQEVAKLAAKWPFDRIEVTDPSSVTLNVDNADVRTVFEMLARGYQMNILVAPDVDGAVTANVDGLTPQQTLQGIVKMCGLNMQQEDGMIYIYSPDQIPADARQLRVFPLDFARAETLEATVQGLLSPVGSAYASKLDEKDNMQTQESIVVVDIPPVIARVEEYILQADLAPRQVLIEARVLEVELSDEMIHGVNFGSILGGDAEFGSFGLADTVLSESKPIFFARFSGSRLGALIDLLETTTDSKTLASPRVQVINGQNARIQVGQQLGFTVATVTQTSTIQDIQFLETGVVLSVTPTISRDNRILMQVKPEVSDGEINPNTLLPEEETREVETSVLLDNHEGVIIGGLIQEKDRTVIKKLPWLGDINYVGKFFQRREAVRGRTEVIVALVPHIVERCVQDQRSAVDYQRTETPLLYGPLQRTCRPWESRLPDVAGAEKHMDVNRVNRALP